MSGSTVARRLTAVIALLAVLCMAAPAVAATPGSHTVKAPVAAHASFFDQLVSWLATLGFGPAAHSQASSAEKSRVFTAPTSAITGQTVVTTDASYGLDPNGHS